MLDRLYRCLLQTSIVVLVTISSLITIAMKPVDAQLETEISSCTSTSSKITCIKQSNGTVVILPVSHNQKNAYPALILLPFTDGTPADYYQASFAEQYETRTANPFIVILPDVKGSSNDWNPPENFPKTVERYDKIVTNDLKALIPKYNIDAFRVALAGYSLGGDLSWALSLKNPSLFRGTIVMNSKSTYRGKSNSEQSKIFQELAANKSRFFMIASEADDKQRLPDMRRAVEELAQYGVTHQFEIIPGINDDPKGLEASAIRTERLMQSVDYVLFNKLPFSLNE
jgi:pimeloyl-ACP methyl ester carboxylesterase